MLASVIAGVLLAAAPTPPSRPVDLPEWSAPTGWIATPFRVGLGGRAHPGPSSR